MNLNQIFFSYESTHRLLDFEMGGVGVSFEIFLENIRKEILKGLQKASEIKCLEKSKKKQATSAGAHRSVPHHSVHRMVRAFLRFFTF